MGIRDACRMQPELPQNRRDCIAGIRAAFADCRLPMMEQLCPGAGLDTRYVQENWGGLTREKIETSKGFSRVEVNDLIWLSSIAFRYYMPALMIMVLTCPDYVDYMELETVIRRCEAVFLSREDGSTWRQVALSPAQAAAFRDWFGQLMTILRKFRFGDGQQEMMDRLRALRARAKVFTPSVDGDAACFLPPGKKRPNLRSRWPQRYSRGGRRKNSDME